MDIFPADLDILENWSGLKAGNKNLSGYWREGVRCLILHQDWA
jgi:hypothetical protein